jgi:hypothetical protein
LARAAGGEVKVTSSAELLDALAAADDIKVDSSLAGMPMITLRPGVDLERGKPQCCHSCGWSALSDASEDHGTCP